MTERVLGPAGGRRKRLWLLGPIAALTVLVGLFVASGAVANAGCTNSLTGSAFEIDPNANFIVDNAASSCIDWLAGGSNTSFRSGVVTDADKPSGSGDDSFGQGTAEDNPNPTVVDGSIPPQKSDLKVFGLYKESNAGGKFLELFWTRINSPNGTTNMDFELNQKFCDPSASPTNCANNGVTPAVTPLRTVGDKLITYDLAKGGTVPAISIRTWGGSAWGAATVISGAGGSAVGAVNTSQIASTDTGGLGVQDAYTFGEAAISFSALFPSGGTCGTFGSAYLKSRSSDSFQAELKDFIAPKKVTISNCTTMTTVATTSAAPGASISDIASLSGAITPTGAVTFKLYSDSLCANQVGGDIAGSALADPEPDGVWTSTGTYSGAALAPGTYYWRAFFAGDSENAATSTACGDANETTTISKLDATIATKEVLVPNDSATIGGGGTFDSSGTATFQLFKPGDTTCANPVALDGTTNPTVSGASPQTVSTANTRNTDTLAGSHAAAIGTWRWKVVYSGDLTHNGITSSCGTETFSISH